MKISNLRPFIPSGADFERSKAFFIDIGFVQNWGDAALCELQFGEVKFLLQNFANKDLQENLMMYVTTDDLDAFHAHLEQLQLKAKYPEVRYSKPQMRPWGIRELHLIDPAGVCWHFG